VRNVAPGEYRDAAGGRVDEGWLRYLMYSGSRVDVPEVDSCVRWGGEEGRGCPGRGRRRFEGYGDELMGILLFPAPASAAAAARRFGRGDGPGGVVVLVGPGQDFLAGAVRCVMIRSFTQAADNNIWRGRTDVDSVAHALTA